MRINTPSLKRTAQILLRANDERSLVKTLEDLLTPAEAQDIAERVLIVEALLSGKTQREVAKKLGVSISKVTVGLNSYNTAMELLFGVFYSE